MDEKERLRKTEELNAQLRWQSHALNTSGGLLKDATRLCDTAKDFMMKLQNWSKQGDAGDVGNKNRYINITGERKFDCK